MRAVHSGNSLRTTLPAFLRRLVVYLCRASAPAVATVWSLSTVLPPVPAGMRKPPRTKDDESGELESDEA